MDAQKGAIVASVYLGVDVILNVTNQLLSLRGSAGVVGRDTPLRFVWFSVIAYLVVSLQGSFQALMPVNRFIHFSDWVIGHSHLAMIGFASFAAIGGCCTSGSGCRAAVQRPRGQLGILAADRRRAADGRRPDHGGAGAGSGLAIRFGVDGIGAGVPAVLAVPHGRRHYGVSRFHGPDGKA